ncbi:hypothetical protein Gorai_013330, partial [Gossypium raimondii]|nr:hypothetical protein [Gossypium raimondii]
MLGAPIKISSSPSCCSSSENRKAIMLSPVCLDKSRSFQFLFSGSKLQCSKTLDIKQLSSAKFRVSRGSKFRVFCDSKNLTRNNKVKNLDWMSRRRDAASLLVRKLRQLRRRDESLFL